MTHTYIFDFCNLYIPKGQKYVNKEMGILIEPLKIAEEFEKNRRKVSSKYNTRDWHTAKCHIKADNEDDAVEIARGLELLYSFAQNRSVSIATYPRILEVTHNKYKDLIYATVKGRRYNRDISPFIDVAIKNLIESNDKKKLEITTVIHAYLISNTAIVMELKFLILWTALEKLSNSHYNPTNSKSKLFDKKEIKTIKKRLNSFLWLYSLIMRDNRLKIIGHNIQKTYLFNHDTEYKVFSYLKSLDLGFDEKEIKKLLEKLMRIRGHLVHDLDSKLLREKHEYYQSLQKIMENVILRLLGVDNSLQEQFIIYQNNRGNVIGYQ